MSTAPTRHACRSRRRSEAFRRGSPAVSAAISDLSGPASRRDAGPGPRTSVTATEVELAMRGDHDAFASLIGAAANRLYSIACLILRDSAAAEDATQEAIVRAWRDVPRLRDVDRFDAWLRRLAGNACDD